MDNEASIGYIGDIYFDADDINSGFRIENFGIHNSTSGDLYVGGNLEEANVLYDANAIICNSDQQSTDRLLSEAGGGCMMVVAIGDKLPEKTLPHAAFQGIMVQNANTNESGWSREMQERRTQLAVRPIKEFANDGSINLDDRSDLLLECTAGSTPNEEVSRVMLSYQDNGEQQQNLLDTIGDSDWREAVMKLTHISPNVTAEVDNSFIFSYLDISGDDPEKALKVFSDIKANMTLLRWRIALFGEPTDADVNQYESDMVGV